MIAQELPHHVLVGAAATDESLVNRLGIAIVEGKVDPELVRVTSLALPVDEKDVPLSCVTAAQAKSGNPEAQSAVIRGSLQLVKQMVRDANGKPTQSLTMDHTFRSVLHSSARVETMFRTTLEGTVMGGSSVFERCLKGWATDATFNPRQTLRDVATRIWEETLPCACGI